jgi:hypothetical protein
VQTGLFKKIAEYLWFFAVDIPGGARAGRLNSAIMHARLTGGPELVQPQACCPRALPAHTMRYFKNYPRGAGDFELELTDRSKLSSSRDPLHIQLQFFRHVSRTPRVSAGGPPKGAGRGGLVTFDESRRVNLSSAP